MAIDYHKLKNWRIPAIETAYTFKDTILYALGVGLGTDPSDSAQLGFVYEEQLKTLPTMPLALAPSDWLRDPATGVDFAQTLHGEQSIEIHAPLPTSGTVVGELWVDKIVDKGASKGALVYSRCALADKASGQLLCTLSSTMFCRADGGFGGPSVPSRRPPPLPDRPADIVCDLPTMPQSALLYRLSGDFNALHADPAVASRSGFSHPILHGLCTFGVAAHALLKTLCDYQPGRVLRIDARFCAPVYPGETIRTEIWRDAPGHAGFRCRVVERDVFVLNNGRFQYRESA